MSDEAPARAAGLRSLGLLLLLWGLLLVVVGTGSCLGFGRPDRSFGPTRVGRSYVFTGSGALISVAGAWTALASLRRADRARMLARSIEAAALGLAVILLVVGVVFHDPRRDPWLVGGVVLSMLTARVAKVWSYPSEPSARPIASG